MISTFLTMFAIAMVAYAFYAMIDLIICTVRRFIGL